MVGVEVVRAVGLRTDSEHGHREPVLDAVAERELLVERETARRAGVDEHQHAVGDVGERALGLEFDRVARAVVAVEQSGGIDQLVADVVAFEVADADPGGGEGVGVDLAAGVRDVVDERGLPDVREARDHDGRLVGSDVGEDSEVVAGRSEPLEVRFDLFDHVREPRERLLSEFARRLDVAAEPTLVLALEFGGLLARPANLREALSDLVDLDERVGEFVVERVDSVEVRPARHDVFEVVREDVRRGLEHGLLGVGARLGVTRARRPRERPVDEFLRGRRGREVFENHALRTAGRRKNAFVGVRACARLCDVGGCRHRYPVPTSSFGYD